MPETNSSSSTVVPVTSTSVVSGLESQIEYWRSIAEELRTYIVEDVKNHVVSIEDELQHWNDDTLEFIYEALINDGNP